MELGRKEHQEVASPKAKARYGEIFEWSKMINDWTCLIRRDTLIQWDISYDTPLISASFQSCEISVPMQASIHCAPSKTAHLAEIPCCLVALVELSTTMHSPSLEHLHLTFQIHARPIHHKCWNFESPVLSGAMSWLKRHDWISMSKYLKKKMSDIPNWRK